ncbi:MAG: 16S rRNA (uracil(1498)-N(3))-methyltransferase [Clostridia bacterium]|nr:16S rRNA (uracil(1498)-N(3))-methyltransferase [Clostridia bacterium]
MRRFFAENIDTAGDRVTLTGDEARHICAVLRMKAGDEVLLINGEGEECTAVIERAAASEVVLRVLERRPGASEPKVRVTLFQCLPKQGKMELIIQKCVELGVWRITPTVSKRCVVKLDGKDNKLARWNKVSREAAKQCGRAAVPEVTSPMALSSIDLSAFDTVIIPYENEEDLTLKSFLRSAPEPKEIAVIIGPEGGFEQSEVDRVLSAGGAAVSLGKRILRTETAGIACLAQIMYELEQ